MSQSHFLIDRLARSHDDHLLWLTREMAGRLAAKEVAEVVDEAYERALSALVGAPAGTQTEIDERKALAWFRSVAANIAAERLKARPRAAAGAVPVASPVVPRRGLGATPLAGSDAVERAVAEAVSTLKPEQRQVMKLCYGDKLAASSIMFLEGLNRSQWASRHSRAVKGFTKAVMDDGAALNCPDGASLIKRDDDWLDAGSGFARHQRQCATCRGFDRSLRRSLAAMPLPIAIAAWKFDALAYFAPAQGPASSPVPVSDAGASQITATSVKSVLAGKAALFAATGVLATAGIGTGVATMGKGSAPVPRQAAQQQVDSRPGSGGPTKLSDHGTAHMTPAQAARRRAQARERLEQELRARP